MKKKLIKFLLSQLGCVDKIKEYPYLCKFGELTHDQANTIYHWIRMSDLARNCETYISPSTMVEVSKNRTYFENFKVEITKELTLIIKS